MEKEKKEEKEVIPEIPDEEESNEEESDEEEDEEEWEEVIPEKKETWKPEKKGEELIGKLVNKKPEVGENKSWLYTIEKEDGEEIAIWGSASLDPRMEECIIGDNLKIGYFGREKNPKTGRKYKAFKIWKIK